MHFQIKKNNKIPELYYIFITEFQINLFDSCDYLFIDATFKMAPKGFYQILNIIGYLSNTGISFPLMAIPMTSKTFEIYYDIFASIKKLLKDRIKNKHLKNIRIVTDFEESLRKSIKLIFPECILDSCYFHYTKILWGKAKEIGLCKKRFSKETFFFYSYLKFNHIF